MPAPPNCENSRDGGYLLVDADHMGHETVARILAIEKAAATKHSEAQQQAASLLAAAEKAAISLHERTLAQAQQQAEQILAAGKQQAEANHAQIIAQAGADAQRLDTAAAQNLEHAVDFVLARVIGQA